MDKKNVCLFFVTLFIVTFLNNSEACMKCGMPWHSRFRSGMGMGMGMGMMYPIPWGGFGGLDKNWLKKKLKAKFDKCDKVEGQGSDKAHEYGYPVPIFVPILVSESLDYSSKLPEKKPISSVDKVCSVVDENPHQELCMCPHCKVNQARSICDIRKYFRNYC